MKFNKLWYLLLCLVFACNHSPKRLSVESTKTESTFTQNISSFCFPLVLELKEIEKIVNQKLPKSLVSDRKIKHNIKLDIQRAGSIRLCDLKNKLITYIPLRIKAKQGKIRSRLKTEFVIELCISTDIDLTPNWNINSKSKLENIQWLENPKVDLLGFQVDIKSLIQKEIEKKEQSIIGKIDKSIRDKISLKPQLEKTWSKLQKAHNITKNSRENMYLHIEPTEIQYIDHTISGGKLRLDLLTSAFFSITTEKSITNGIRTSLPKLKKSSNSCNGFDLNVYASLDLDSINNSLNRLLNQNLEMSVEGYSITPTSAKVQASGTNLLIEVNIAGALNGTFKGLCNVDLDSNSQQLTISLNQTEIVNGDIELELAHLIFGGFINEYLNDFDGFQLTSSLDQIPKLIQDGIAKGKSGDKWHPEIYNMSSRLTSLELTKKSIIIKAHCTGELKIMIDNIQS